MVEGGADGNGEAFQLVPDTLALTPDQGDHPVYGVTGQQAGAPGFTFAPRLVLIGEVLRACACHQLHIGGAVHLGSRGDTGGAGGSEPAAHTQPHQHRTQVLLSPGTDRISLPTVEGVGSEPREVTNEGKMLLASSR